MAQEPITLESGQQVYPILINGEKALNMTDAQLYMNYKTRRGLELMLERNGANVYKRNSGGKERYVMLADLERLNGFSIDTKFSASGDGDEEE